VRDSSIKARHMIKLVSQAKMEVLCLTSLQRCSGLYFYSSEFYGAHLHPLIRYIHVVIVIVELSIFIVNISSTFG